MLAKVIVCGETVCVRVGEEDWRETVSFLKIRDIREKLREEGFKL
jgi:hypothetical protein